MKKVTFWRGARCFASATLFAVLAVPILSITYMSDAEAVPAFARKYDMSCNVCHTRQPRLNPYGQRFMENGYQLPGTADGGRKEKHLLGGETNGVALDDISNYMALRFRGDVQLGSMREEVAGVSEDPDIIAPRTVNLFFAGTVKKDLSFFFEIEYDTQDPAESAMVFERSMLMFDNLFGPQNGTVKVGIFDPSSLYSFPTHRQQINPIKPIADTADFPPAIGRAPLLPLAFSAKMYGMTTGSSNDGNDGFAVLPFQPYLFNAPSQKGVSLHGRVFGNSLLYQVGVAQNMTAEANPQTRFDSYVMLRYDILGEFSNLQFSGFYYTADKASMPTLNMGSGAIYANKAVGWDRYGVAARWQHKAWDIYGTYIADTIDKPDFGAMSDPGGMSTWETDASGISIEADYLLTDKWMLGARYDQMSGGGLIRGMPESMNAAWDEDLNQDASFLALIAKYYPAPNIGLYARYHQNLESSAKLPTAIMNGGAEHPATNLTSMFTVGIDMAF